MTQQSEPDEITILRRSLLDRPPVHPNEFFSLVAQWNESAQILCAVTAAGKSGLLDFLKIPRTREEITNQFPFPDIMFPLIEVLHDAKVILVSNEMYSASNLAKCYFSSGSPYQQIAYLDKLLWHIRDLWLDLPDILKNGPKHYDEQEFFASYSLPSMAANALTGRLQDVTAAVIALPNFPRARRMIDLGGGHGLYALSLALCNTALEAVVFDMPEVIPLTRSYIHAYHLESQVSVMGGNFFTDDIGADYDIILSSSNPSGKSPEMIVKIASALRQGGYFVNIQPGDHEPVRDAGNQLEWELWTFSGEQIPKSMWGKKKGFFTREYQQAVLDAGLRICTDTEIEDPYIKGYSVTLMIAEKE